MILGEFYFSVSFLWIADSYLCKIADKLKDFFFRKIPNSLIWFSHNPSAAIHMLLDLVLIPFVGPVRKLYLKEQYESERLAYPGHVIKANPIGATLLFISEFLLAYLLIYLIID